MLLEMADMRSRGAGEGTSVRSAIGEECSKARGLDEGRDLKILGVRRVGNVGCMILMAAGLLRTAQYLPPGILRSTPTPLSIAIFGNIAPVLLRDAR
jgi:hypothetical protein